MIDFACKRFEIDDVIRCSLGLAKSDLKITDFLVKLNKKQASSTEIASKLSLDISTVQRSLKILHDKLIVSRQQVNLPKGGYSFVYAIKDKEEFKKKILEILRGWFKSAEKEIERL